MKHSAAEWIPLFPEEEIPYILAAVLRSGAQLKKMHPTELENELTDRLRDKLDRDPVLRTRPVELFREVPLYDRRRARRKQLGRTDLLFLYSTGDRKPWPYYAIESKRLHVTFRSGWQSLISEYVTGNQGMLCFIEQRYATGLTSGGMLGYVFDGDTAKARSSVAVLIKENHVKLKSAVHDLQTSSVLGSENRISESIHTLSHGSFTIYHVFLSV